jgi:small subunit ribosomal protein S17e
MGRIKTVSVRSIGDELVKDHGDRFGTDFEKNKKALTDIRPVKSKRVRNFIAGYITSKMQKIKKSGV